MIRREEIRFKILRDGAEYGEIFPDNSAPTLRCDSNGDIKMSLQGTFLATALDNTGREIEVDWMRDEIQPTLIINGVSNPLSVLIPTTVTPTENATTKTLKIEAYDHCWAVKNYCSLSMVHINAGASYVDTVEALLIDAGVGTILKTDSAAVLAEAREDWDIGTPYLTIINDLLSEINYKSVWFNADGIAILEPESVPTGANVKHVFTNKKPNAKNPAEADMISVTPQITRTTDIYSAPNVFICVCSNADKSAGMKAVSENTNPQSPLSIIRRGRRIVQVVQIDNIADQTELQTYADRLRNESTFRGEVIQAETMLLPGFGVKDVTGFQYDDLFSLCFETSWQMQLKPGGMMTHTLQRVVVALE